MAVVDDGYLDELMNLPSIAGGVLSPNGRNLAFMMHRVHKNLDVFFKRVIPGEPPVFEETEALTRTDDMTFFSDWFKDSRSVLVSQDSDGDERNVLYRVFLDRPGEMERLTMDDPPFFLKGGETGPSGRYLYYSANYDFENGKVLEETGVVRHDLDTGKVTTLALPEKPNYLVPSLNRAGTHLLYNRKDLDPSGDQLWMVDTKGKTDVPILDFGPRAKVYGQWMPDSRRIVFETDMIDGTRLESISIGIYNIVDMTYRWLVDPRTDGRNIETFIVPEVGNRIILVETREAKNFAHILDVDTMTQVSVPVRRGTLIPYHPLGGGYWIGIHFSSTDPRNIVVLHESTGDADPVKVTDVAGMRGFDTSRLIPASDYRWRSVDDLPIHGWLYRPRVPNGKAVVHVHGGPTAHSIDSINYEIQYLAHLGFTVLDPNYRGSTGYGIAFREKIKEDGWGGLEQEDIRMGIRKMMEDGFVEPGRVGITGTSYGGYSSWFAITKFGIEDVRAAAPISGMTDLVVDYETTRPDLRPYSVEMMGGTPDEIPNKYRDRSPINFVQNIRGALLIVQGARDPNVTLENVTEVEKRLEENGIPYETLVFPDEGHGVVKVENQRFLYRRLAEFFDSNLNRTGHEA